MLPRETLLAASTERSPNSILRLFCRRDDSVQAELARVVSRAHPVDGDECTTRKSEHSLARRADLTGLLSAFLKDEQRSRMHKVLGMTTSMVVRPSLTIFSTLIALVVASQSGFSQTNGYYVALLRSECTSAPLSPPAVGQTVVGPDYVMRTVAEGDPLDFSAAQRAVTDATFASLMPKYCALSRTAGAGCVTNRVQWNVMTYDATGNPKISGCAASGCNYHTCDATHVPKGFYVALLRSECTSAPLSPPAVGQTVVGPDYVMMTVAEGDPLDFSAAQRVVTDATFASLMPKYCALSRTAGAGCVTNRVQWNVMTYDATGNPKISGCAASGCNYHTCDATHVPKGFYVALLRSECTSAPLSPPAVGQTVVGPDYVMMTVAEGDPLDFSAAQRVV